MFVGKTIRCLSLFVKKSPLYAVLSVVLEVGAALLLPINLFFMSALIETAVTGSPDFVIAALFAVTALVQVVISFYKKKLSLLLGFEMPHAMQRAFLGKCSNCRLRHSEMKMRRAIRICRRIGVHFKKREIFPCGNE